MKKLILMTSALTLVGGAAVAEITVGGEATVSYGNWETGTAANATFGFDTEITLDMEETTASGLTYGASLTLENGNSVSQGVIYVGGGFGKVSFGIDEFDELEGDDLSQPLDVNGALEEEAYGDVKYEGTFGDVTASLVADAGLGVTTDGATVAATSADWILNLGYDGGNFNASLETDSTNFWEIGVGATVGSFDLGATFDDASAWEVTVGTSFGGVNVELSHDDAGDTGIDLDGEAGDVAWAVGYNTNGDTTGSINYTMGAVSVGLAYDNDDAGCVNGGGACASTTNGEDYGDAADVILTLGYAASDMLSFEFLANDQSEYELSMTAGFTF